MSMKSVNSVDTYRIRDDFRKGLLDILDSIRGSKALVLESFFIQPLGLVADAATLKDHGIDMFCTMDADPWIAGSLQEKGVTHIVYLVHSIRLESIHAAKEHAVVCQESGSHFQYHVILTPQRMKAAEIMFEMAGLLGDTLFVQLDVPWVPLSSDVLSLEHGSIIKEIEINGDMTCLHEIAYDLYKLQETYGSAKKLYAKGDWSSHIVRTLGKMRKEAGKDVPSHVDSSIDEIVLLDRSVDWVTPMCTQLTYEGLLDEVLGLRYGQIRGKSLPGHEAKKVGGLDEKDPIFREIRDKFYGGARLWVSNTLKEIQKFRDSDMAAADVSSLKGFVSDLREKFSRMPLHTSLLERLGNYMKSVSFAARQKIEASILDEDLKIDDIYDRIYKEDDIFIVLRLLCLYCQANSGIAKKDYDSLRKDILNTYGYENIVLLHALQTSKLLYRKDDKKRSAFSASKALLGILMEDGQRIDEENPNDIHFAYAGYAPLSTRIIQRAVLGQWNSIGLFLSSIPGDQIEIIQGATDEGYAQDTIRHVPPVNSSSIGSSLDHRNVLVVFVGGVTCAEVSTLRFLASKKIVPCSFVIATTKIVNGSSILASFTENDIFK